jgi:hypothetical protein
MKICRHPRIKEWPPQAGGAYPRIGYQAPTSSEEVMLTRIEPETEINSIRLVCRDKLGMEHSYELMLKENSDFASKLRKLLNKSVGQTLFQIGQMDIEYVRGLRDTSGPRREEVPVA